MHALGVLVVITQILFAYHAIRNRKDSWVYIILLFPMVGCVLYLAMEVIPGSGRQYAIQQMGADILRTVDPTRELRKLKEKADLSPSVRNKHDLAREMIRCGLNAEAAEILKGLPVGVFDNDPNILLDLSRAYFFLEDFPSTLSTLDRLKAANPDFRNSEAHLIYARSLENLGRWDESLNEYEGLARYFAGEEAKCRMGLLLQKMGHTEKAKRIFGEISEKSKRGSRSYYKREKEWIRIAERYAGE